MIPILAPVLSVDEDWEGAGFVEVEVFCGIEEPDTDAGAAIAAVEEVP